VNGNMLRLAEAIVVMSVLWALIVCCLAMLDRKDSR
jgi:hypothetical protein